MLLGQLAGSDSSQPPSAAVAPTAIAPTAVAPTKVAPTTSRDLVATPEADRPIGVGSMLRCPVRLGGFALREKPRIPVWSLERWDCNARKGPWSVAIRSSDGHFGVKSAVVTFPVPAEGSEAPVAKPPGGRWNPAARMLIWPLGNGHAQIVGDLGQATLAELATGITVRGGKPHWRERGGFTAVAATTFGSPVVHEMRYATADLRVESKLGAGFVYTGVMSGASFEGLAFEDQASPMGSVRGKPAIYSSGRDGSGTLAWESAPDEVTYLRFNGSATRAVAIETLRTLADKGRPITYAQWQTKDRIPAARSHPG
jgi:hypothetical protein